MYPYNEPASLPIQPVEARGGRWLHVSLDFPGRTILLRVWRAQVGRVALYLLDSNDSCPPRRRSGDGAPMAPGSRASSGPGPRPSNVTGARCASETSTSRRSATAGASRRTCTWGPFPPIWLAWSRGVLRIASAARRTPTCIAPPCQRPHDRGGTSRRESFPTTRMRMFRSTKRLMVSIILRSITKCAGRRPSEAPGPSHDPG